MRSLTCLLVAVAALAAGPETAVITGRVFDVYHRPVRAARVVTIERRGERLFTGAASAVVDDTGMYRLSVAPGRYVLAVTPPPYKMDFCTVFPVYFPDTTAANRAQAVVLGSGELRPFLDFLLLDVEPHRVSGRVTGAPAEWASRAIAVSLFASTGYGGPLQTVRADAQGFFQLEQVPAGSYELTANGPVRSLENLRPVLGDTPWHGSVHIEVSAPAVSGIQIPLRRGPADVRVLKPSEGRR